MKTSGKYLLVAAMLLAPPLTAGEAAAFESKFTRRAVNSAESKIEECEGIARRQRVYCLGLALEETWIPGRPDYAEAKQAYRDAGAALKALAEKAAAEAPAEPCQSASGAACERDFVTVPEAKVAEVEDQATEIITRTQKKLLSVTNGHAQIHYSRLAAPLDNAKQLLLV